MNQNDYIILRDEDGKAYIAHAGLLDNARNAIRGAANSISTTAQQVANKAKGVGRGVRQNHKYILKVFENGRTRYFYKQEEVKAYYEAKKRGIKNAAEYAQNAVKDKASDVADAAKNVVNKATGATANKAAETAKKNADDASRWAKMTERVHKENVANFKQNPTEANLARAKQSGQAVTRANQNEKNARKEADKAQDMADQHPVNKAKSAFNQAKASASNTVTNAETNYDRMKSEFRDKVKDIAGYDERERRDAAKQVTDTKRAKGQTPNISENTITAQTQKAYNKTPLGMIENAKKAISSAKDTAEKVGIAVKDKSEDLSAKAKSTAQSARDSVKGMIDNARSSTAKAVNEAWDRIPKNSDGTVNPFDKNFQSTYNDWKAKKDKYDSSLAGRAKDVAEKATDAVQDMIDQAKKVAKNATDNIKDRTSRRDKNEMSESEWLDVQSKKVAGVYPYTDWDGSAYRPNTETGERLGSNLTREQEQTNTGSRQTKRTQEEMNEMRNRQNAEEQRSNDKKAAQRLSTSAELKGGEYVSLIEKYKQRYGEDYQNYLSKDEASKLQKARDNYQTAVEDANRAWDEFDKKWTKNK